MKNLIDQYIESKQLAWAPSTLRSESHRLTGIAELLDGKPETLWKAIQEMAPYGRKTIWTRVTSFWQWALDRGLLKGPNKYRVFKQENARLFKHVYQPKTPKIDYQEACKRINEMEDESMRNKAKRLLSGGLRYSEEDTIEDNHVIGKGSKSRRVFCEQIDGPIFKGSYHRFYHALKKVGLKPHDLRKIAATELARKGLREADLMKAMGWESIVTAKSYLAPINDNAMEKVFRTIQEGVRQDESRPEYPEKQVS
jgi:integrase